MSQPSPKLSVIMPVYNEQRTIEEAIRRVQCVAIDKEILIIDDGSTDGTRELLANSPCAHAVDVRVLLQPANTGKGAALRRGIREARGDYIIVQDADLECDPEDLHRLFEPIERGEADAVCGSRFLAERRDSPVIWHSFGNKLLTAFTRLFTGLRVTDVGCCYKLIPRERALQLHLRENRFGIETEMTVKLAKKKCRIVEVPVSYHPRGYSEGKKIRITDGLWCLWCVVRYRFFD